MDRTDPVDVLARTIWGEARGDGRLGMVAVAACILNRAKHPRWWGHDVLSVCLQPWQFSCWNADDPNLPKMQQVDGEDVQFAMACDIARAAIAGVLTDPTRGADSYYDIRMAEPPNWAVRAVQTVVVLHHRYMRVELAAPSGEPDAPPVSRHSPASPPDQPEPSADDLNAAELALVQHQA